MTRVSTRSRRLCAVLFATLSSPTRRDQINDSTENVTDCSISQLRVLFRTHQQVTTQVHLLCPAVHCSSINNHSFFIVSVNVSADFIDIFPSVGEMFECLFYHSNT